MRILFFIISVLFCGMAANAQTSVKQVKFIETIQLTPGPSSGEQINSKAKPSADDDTLVISYSPKKSSIEKCSALQFKYCTLLDTNVEAIKNIKLYNFIDGWMDTRYRYGGTNRSGIDCSAFADSLINNVYNINLPRTAHEQYDVCQKLTRDNLLEGDLVFFNTMGGVSHVGVYLGNGYFVHSSIHGVTINNLSDDYYNRKFICGGRIIMNN
jgi:hypothetical protein